MQQDTHPKIQKMIIDGYRKMSPQKKMQQVDEMTKTVQQMALARIRQEYKTALKKNNDYV